MKSTKIRSEIEQLQKAITTHQTQIENLKKELEVVLNQETARRLYISSKEIIVLIEKSTGHTVDMSTIKRWSDKGYLGEVYDERQMFWALNVGSGKQRNLYKRENVMDFLYNRGYVKPRFSILDEAIVLSVPKQPVGTIIRKSLDINGFVYTVQLEDTMGIIDYVPEDKLRRVN